jgi:hypothetical protein
MNASLRKFLILGTSLAVLAGAGWGLRCAMRSPMFTLQVVEVADQLETEGATKVSPVDAQTIAQIAAVPVGTTNLFDLDLKPIEARVLANPWIREVALQKHFPSTLSISVTFREPQALMQGENGTLSYVDVDGKAFGQVNLMYQPDLPVIASGSSAHVTEALRLIHAWEASELAKSAQISSLAWDSDRGFRALVTYSLAPVAVANHLSTKTTEKNGLTSPAAHGRTFLELGQEFDGAQSGVQFGRLSQVFRYLSSNRVAARQIWADAGKKIVVRTARGS